MDTHAHRLARAGEATGTLLRLEGKDALPLLHRISTQALEDLAPGTARATLFCDRRGRLLHRAVVAATSDRTVWLLRPDAPTLPLVEFLELFIFRDDVRATVPREDWSVHLVTRSAGLAPGALREREGLPHEVQIRPDWALVLEPAAAPAPGGGIERARILAGLPRHGHEIAEPFTPFEVGLGPEVHLHKGCYTGQEALLRMMTYRSVRRRLVRVQGAGAPPAPPLEIRAGGKSVGWVTSTASEIAGAGGSPATPRWTGLAVITHAASEAGVALAIEHGAIEIAHRFEILPPLGL